MHQSVGSRAVFEDVEGNFIPLMSGGDVDPASMKGNDQERTLGLSAR